MGFIQCKKCDFWKKNRGNLSITKRIYGICMMTGHLCEGRITADNFGCMIGEPAIINETKKELQGEMG